MSTTTEENILSAHTIEEIDEWVSRYPEDRKKSAVLAALRAAQHQNNGYLTVPLMDAIADYLELSKIEVYEVASFYSMYELNPVARHNVAVCTNVCCMLMGSDTIVDHLQKKCLVYFPQSTSPKHVRQREKLGLSFDGANTPDRSALEP